MSVKCSQCQNFTLSDDENDYCDNGHCADLEHMMKIGTVQEISAFFVKQLGGLPIFSEMLRECNKFLPIEVQL